MREDDRIPLVLWSGGLDSTLLVLLALMRGNVDVLEVTLQDTYPLHREAEKKSRDAIYELICELRTTPGYMEHFKGEIRKRIRVDIAIPRSPDIHGYTSQMPGQQLSWITAAYYNHDSFRHNEILSGLLLSDSASFSIQGLRKMWEGLLEHNPASREACDWVPNSCRHVELNFPFYEGAIVKSHIVDGIWLTPFLREVWREKISPLTWTCYAPKQTDDQSIVPCLVCDSCKARSDTQYATKALEVKEEHIHKEEESHA